MGTASSSAAFSSTVVERRIGNGAAEAQLVPV